MTITQSDTAQPTLAMVPAPAVSDVPVSVPCIHCSGPVPTDSFIYWAHARQLVWMFALCPACGGTAKLASHRPHRALVGTNLTYSQTW
jgi:hypothetical protein